MRQNSLLAHSRSADAPGAPGAPATPLGDSPAAALDWLLVRAARRCDLAGARAALAAGADPGAGAQLALREAALGGRLAVVDLLLGSAGGVRPDGPDGADAAGALRRLQADGALAALPPRALYRLLGGVPAGALGATVAELLAGALAAPDDVFDSLLACCPPPAVLRVAARLAAAAGSGGAGGPRRALPPGPRALARRALLVRLGEGFASL